ncbi:MULTISPECIES: RDD family protein [Mumia]|uniref:RDD family protein n=1 Tax=Mumia xiangluensis TaxID=1678900 RepID=A0ABW1QR48_9ACTN|nr:MULTISPECIES: RDD family protein [Mumia]
MSVAHSHPVGPGAGLQGKPAGVVTRTIAGGIDYALAVVAVGSTYAGLAALSFLYNPVSWHWPRWPFIVLLVLGGVYLGGYLTACWATSGKTLGGQVMGTRVLGRHGGRVRLWRAALRALVVVVFPIGLFWSAVNRHSRSVQDIVTGTEVVYSWRTAV